jgi:hypothetical protein
MRRYRSRGTFAQAQGKWGLLSRNSAALVNLVVNLVVNLLLMKNVWNVSRAVAQTVCPGDKTNGMQRAATDCLFRTIGAPFIALGRYNTTRECLGDVQAHSQIAIKNPISLRMPMIF